MRNPIRVPIKACKTFDGRTYGVIEFHCAGSPRKGIFLHHVLSNPGLIAHGNEPVLRGFGCLRLYLSWPGYSSTAAYAIIQCGQMSRARLAFEVSQHILAFLQRCASVPVSSNASQWRIGPGSITAANVILVSIIDMGEGIWQADMELAP